MDYDKFVCDMGVGGLVVKLAVAMESRDSASPGFDSRPTQFFNFSWVLVLVFVFGLWDDRGAWKFHDLVDD